MVEQSLDKLAERAWQWVVRVFDQFLNPRGDIANALGNDEAEIRKQSANLIGLGGAHLLEALANPVQRGDPESDGDTARCSYSESRQLPVDQGS